jgi:hypothetical protein
MACWGGLAGQSAGSRTLPYQRLISMHRGRVPVRTLVESRYPSKAVLFVELLVVASAMSFYLSKTRGLSTLRV